MPSYTVRGPSGSSYMIEGPEGATAEQLGRFIAASVPAERQRAALHDQVAARVDADPISTGARNFAKELPGLEQFGAGYGKAGADMALGLRQIAGKLPDRNTAGGWLSRAALNFVPGGNLIGALPGASQDEVDETKRLDAPLLHTGAGMTGNLIGTIADTAPAMLIPGANTVAGAAATGAVLGATQAVGSDENRLKNTALGGTLGAAGAGIGKAVGAGYRAVKAVAEPFTAAGPEQIAGRTLTRFANDPSTIAKATNAPTSTGALPTLAEQTGDIGIARLQDALRSADPQFNNLIGTRLSQNNATRVAKLHDMAGTDGARDFAVANRAGTAAPMYEDAFKVVPDASLLSPEQARSLQTLMKSPAVQSAMKDAQTIAKNNGSNVGPSNASGSIEGMHNMKLSLDDAISTARAAGQMNKAKSIEAAQKQLLALMESMSPEYKTARSVYADMSKPINQMDIAKKLADRGLSNGTDLTTGVQTIHPNAFLGALKNEKNLIGQATGRDLGKLEDVMTPEQLNLIGTIGKEADRAAAVTTAGNGVGSGTAQRSSSRDILRSIISPSATPGGAAPTMAQKGAQAVGKAAIDYSGLGLLAKGANWAYEGIASPRVQEALSKVVLNPGEAQKALDAAARASVRLPETLKRRLLLQAAQQTPAAVNRSTNPLE